MYFVFCGIENNAYLPLFKAFNTAASAVCLHMLQTACSSYQVNFSCISGSVAERDSLSHYSQISKLNTCVAFG